jgi:hypothetical protein
MSKIDFSEVKRKANRYLNGNDKFEFLAFGIEADDNLYIYGKTADNHCFIVNGNGELIRKDEAITIFRDFIQLWTIFMEKTHQFQNYMKKNPSSSLQKLTFNLEEISTKYSSMEHNVKENIKKTQHLLADVWKEQQALKENLEKISQIYKEKCAEGMYIKMDEVERIISINDRMDWNVYNQARNLDDAIEPMKEIYSYITELFTFTQKYFDFNVVSLKKELKLFVSRKTIDMNKTIIQEFEKNQNGGKYAKGEIGFKKYINDRDKTFDKEFNQHAIPLLMN